jgi:hypothetical protein
MISVKKTALFFATPRRIDSSKSGVRGKIPDLRVIKNDNTGKPAELGGEDKPAQKMKSGPASPVEERRKKFLEMLKGWLEW